MHAEPSATLQAEPHPRIIIIFVFIKKKMPLSYRIPVKLIGMDIVIARHVETSLFMCPYPIVESELEKPVS